MARIPDSGGTFTPGTWAQEPSAGSTLWKVLACIAVPVFLFKIFGWWQDRDPGAAVPSPGTLTRGSPGSVPRLPPRPDGRDARSPAADLPAPRQAAPGTPSVSKCVGKTGTAYSDGPCAAGTAASTVATPPDLNVSQGLAGGRVRSERQLAPDAFVPAPQAAAVAKNDAGSDCEALTAESHRWDAHARQPLSGHAQDEIRARQREIRARKFELRC